MATEFRLAPTPSPLEGELHLSNGMAGMFGAEFIEVVHSALRYAPHPDLRIYNAAGRNYYVPLPQAAGPYDALQVAGGGNFDLGITSNEGIEESIVDPEATEGDRIVVPPSEAAGLFTSYTTYFEAGRRVEKTNINPVGSYTSRSASRKIEATQRAFGLLTAPSMGVITPRYVGKFEYAVADQFGEPQTAILMLVPSLGRRFDAKLLVPLNALRAGQAPPAGEPFAEELRPYHRTVVLPQLFSIASGIATMHRAGLNHHQPTPGNTDALIAPGDMYVPYITDWDTTTEPSAEDRARSQALDMFIALQTASAGLKRLARLEAIGKAAAAELVLETTLALMEGYFTGRGGLYAKIIKPEDAVNVATDGYDTDESLDLIESWLA